MESKFCTLNILQTKDLNKVKNSISCLPIRNSLKVILTRNHYIKRHSKFYKGKNQIHLSQ